LRDVAGLGAARAVELEEVLSEVGAPRLHAGAYLNEFVVRVPDADELFARCRANRILPGIALAQWYPELRNSILTCVTEMNDREEVDRLVGTAAG
jgi:glycine dehydrogenase subunit 1